MDTRHTKEYDSTGGFLEINLKLREFRYTFIISLAFFTIAAL